MYILGIVQRIFYIYTVLTSPGMESAIPYKGGCGGFDGLLYVCCRILDSDSTLYGERKCTAVHGCPNVRVVQHPPPLEIGEEVRGRKRRRPYRNLRKSSLNLGYKVFALSDNSVRGLYICSPDEW